MALYFAELLPNIHAVRAYIRPKQLAAFDPGQLLVTPHHLLYGQATVSLPVDVDPASASVTHNPDTNLVDLKLQCRQRHPQPPDPLTPPFSAQDLAALRSLGCASCLRQLAPAPATAASAATSPSFQHIKNLPSEHWLELIDCWLCHEDQDQKQYANKLRDIGAQYGTLLVGNTYFLLHPDDVVEKSVQRDRDAPEIDWTRGTFKKWIPVTCAQCSTPLGEGYYEMPRTPNESNEANVELDPILLAVKLTKYAVSVTRAPTDASSLPVVETHPFTTFIALDFFEAAKVHANYRFVIEGRGSKKTYLLVWLFNWDTKIAYNEGFRDADADAAAEGQEGVTKNVMKVLYIDCANPKDPQVASQLTTWRADRTAEHLIYPDQICAQLAETLRLSTSYQPEEMRLFQGFLVGFLEKGL